MAKEWVNKDRYHPSHGVLEPRMSLLKGKAFVRKVPAWGEKSVVGGRGPASETGQTGFETGQTGLEAAWGPVWFSCS
jgi:hypothetical protein